MGPFNIYHGDGTPLDFNVPKAELIEGKTYEVPDTETAIIIESMGDCVTRKTFQLKHFTILEPAKAKYQEVGTSCMWIHLNNPEIYNTFYGRCDPYILEYPFSYQYQDEICQNVIDYTKVYKYTKTSTGFFDRNQRVEVDDVWFNKAVLYNGQQSSGVLELVAKPKNNLQAYGLYPIFKTDSKVITYTKSDNLYQYNTFWAIQKSSSQQMFISSCQSLSLDKIVNQANMDYTNRTYVKAPLRAKDLKIRHILDNNCTTKLVSQFIVAPAQISYK